MTSIRHRWIEDDDPRVVVCGDGIDRKYRVCRNCSMTRITNIPPRGHPWHSWKTADGENWQGEATPPCLPVNMEVAR